MKNRNGKIKVLFFAEAATLAHVTRPFVLANELDPDTYDVHFASNEAYRFLFKDVSFQYHKISCISTQEFNERLANGRKLYSLSELDNYVQEDLRIIKHVDPDLIIGDFRLSLSVSARLENIPYISIVNAHWSPFTERSNFPVPEHPMTRLFGPKIMEKIFPLIQPIAFMINLLPFKQLKRRYGMSEPKTLKEAYVDADYVLYPELISLVPTHDLPKNHRYIRPILWSPEVQMSQWTRVDDHKKKVFVSLGTSGDVSNLKSIISGFAGMDCKILIATAGRLEIEDNSEDVQFEKFIDGTSAAKWADLVICNGGSGSVYQAIAGETPVLGICSNMDQFLNMENVSANGAGIIIRASEVSEENIRRTASKLLTDNAYKVQVRKLAEEFKSTSKSFLFKDMINEVSKNLNLFTVTQNSPEKGHSAKKKSANEINANIKLSPIFVKILILGKKFLTKDKVLEVSNKSDREEARKLVYAEYRKKDLCSKNLSKQYFNIFSFLPSTTTLVSKRNGVVNGTISILEDGLLGLPADCLYQDELDKLRRQGKILVECGALALDNSRFKKSAHSLRSIKKFSTMATLFAGLVNHVYQFTKASHLVIMVNPRHVDIYKNIGFKQFAEIRHYPHVNKPAVPMLIEVEDLITVESHRPFSLFFCSNMKLLKRKQYVRYCAGEISQLIFQHSEFFSSLSSREEKVLLSLYPDLERVITINKLSSYHSKDDGMELEDTARNFLLT